MLPNTYDMAISWPMVMFQKALFLLVRGGGYCWFLIRHVLWHSLESNFAASTRLTMLHNEYESYTFRILPHFAGPMNQIIIVGNTLAFIKLFVESYFEYVSRHQSCGTPFACQILEREAAKPDKCREFTNRQIVTNRAPFQYKDRLPLLLYGFPL